MFGWRLQAKWRGKMNEEDEKGLGEKYRYRFVEVKVRLHSGHFVAVTQLPEHKKTHLSWWPPANKENN